jgi:hypothetical protein
MLKIFKDCLDRLVVLLIHGNPSFGYSKYQQACKKPNIILRIQAADLRSMRRATGIRKS